MVLPACKKLKEMAILNEERKMSSMFKIFLTFSWCTVFAFLFSVKLLFSYRVNFPYLLIQGSDLFLVVQSLLQRSYLDLLRCCTTTDISFFPIQFPICYSPLPNVASFTLLILSCLTRVLFITFNAGQKLSIPLWSCLCDRTGVRTTYTT